MLKELIRNKIDIVDSVDNWEEAIKKGAELLIENKCIEPRYVDNIIKNIKESGPYIVLGDGMAMSHARPEDGVIKNGITLLKIKNGVDFDEKNKIFPETFVQVRVKEKTEEIPVRKSSPLVYIF